MKVQRSGSRSAARKGAVIVLAALLMVMLLGMLAFSIDLGYQVTVQTELQRSADAGALAGVGVLVDGTDVAQQTATQYCKANFVGSEQLKDSEISVEAGLWTNGAFGPAPSGTTPSALRVTLNNRNQPYYFGRLFGRETFDSQAQSVAVYQPRDIMVVLDFSGSMSDDSELKSINTLGRAWVEGNLATMYSELGSPTYGGLQFAPTYVTLNGMTPTNSNMAQISVQFLPSSVKVTSTKTISSVRLQFSGGATQNVTGLSGTTVTVAGTGSNANKRIDVVWVKSGTNESNNPSGYGERFEDTAALVKQFFNLTNVPYPYPSGSWDDYISYMKSNSAVYNAGYRKGYGYMTWINYLQENKAAYNQTPDLWKTSEQPVTALKDAFDVFLSYMQSVDTEDRVGLAIYTSANGTALVETYPNGEKGLTYNFAQISNTCRQRQAGHYHSQTNIGDGLKAGRDEIVNNGRSNAARLIILMTDGLANLPGNSSQAKTYLLNQANVCAASKIPVVTITLGTGADTAIMQQVADITGGVHFNVPGGRPIADIQEDLEEVFKQVANDHPLKLVK